MLSSRRMTEVDHHLRIIPELVPGLMYWFKVLSYILTSLASTIDGIVNSKYLRAMNCECGGEDQAVGAQLKDLWQTKVLSNLGFCY